MTPPCHDSFSCQTRTLHNKTSKQPLSPVVVKLDLVVPPLYRGGGTLPLFTFQFSSCSGHLLSLHRSPRHSNLSVFITPAKSSHSNTLYCTCSGDSDSTVPSLIFVSPWSPRGFWISILLYSQIIFTFRFFGLEAALLQKYRTDRSLVRQLDRDCVCHFKVPKFMRLLPKCNNGV